MLENEERESCKSLNDSCDDLYSCYDSKDFNHVYELSKKEKSSMPYWYMYVFISLYRVLPIEIQNKILKELKEEVDRD